MLCRLSAQVAGVLTWFAMFGMQAVQAADAEIAFDPPKVVAIRQSNGAPARGHLLRITENELWLRVLNGSEVKFKLEKVRSVKSSDRALEFWPGNESFSEFAARIAKMPGVAFSGTLRNRPGARNPGRSPAVANSGAAGDEDPDDQRHRGKRAREAATQQNPPASTANRNPFGNQATASPQAQHGRTAPPRETDDLNASANAVGTDPAPGSEILTCSNCMQDLPANFRSGDKCPNCGKVAVFDDGGSSNPFAVAGGSGAGGGNPFAANGAAPAAPQAQPAPAVPQVQNQGFDMANMPWFAKAGIFAAFVIVGWVILQRRG